MKVTTAAKPVTAAKPAKATAAKKTTARSKAAKSKKHAATASTKHAAHVAHLKHLAHVAHTKKLGLSLGEGVACCTAEALAASLRLAGGRVGDDDVLELHWRAGGGTDTGVTILAALEAASVYGLAGYRPLGSPVSRSYVSDFPGLVLGLELPGPHAVLAGGARWWSWGKRYDPSAFPHARIEEAWAVSW